MPNIGGVDWNSLGTMPDDYAVAGLGTPRAETPGPSTSAMPSVAPLAQTPPQGTTSMPFESDSSGS